MILLAVIFVEEGSLQACLDQQIHCLSGSSCIPISDRCDGVKNCPDGSDEFYCSPANISYALIWSTTTSDDGLAEMHILYGDPDEYRGQIELNQTFDGNVATPKITSKNSGYKGQTLETDFEELGFYFSYRHSQNVWYAPIQSTGSSYNTTIIMGIPVSDSVTGLSVDWVSKLLYWSDATYKRIGLARTMIWSTWAPVVEDGLTSPQDVVVYPPKSFLFWSDVGDVPKIERLDLTNGVRQVTVSNTDLQRPTTLVIDFVDGRLLFLDSKASRIGSVLLDGSNLTFWTLDLFRSISSFSLYKGYIFLGDMKRATSYVYNFTQQTFVGSVSATGENGIIDLAVYEKGKQPTVASPCTAKNGDCEHHCFTINSTSRVCKCAMGYFLNADGISCDIKVFSDDFLLVADVRQQIIFQVNISNGEVRAASKIPPSVFMPILMDYDPQTMDIYAFDYYNNAIRRISITDPLSSSTILQTQDAKINGIVIDTVDRLLYYTDGLQNTIVQMTISGSIFTQTVLSEPNSKPIALVLDVFNRFIFWSNCYRLGSCSIEQANISNISNHHSVISGLSACPAAFAVDLLNQVIYWGDNVGVIRRVGYDGTGQSDVYRSTSTSVAYAGLALDETYLYISDSYQKLILRLNRTSLQLSNLTALRFIEPHSIVLYRSITTTTAPPRETTTNSVAGVDSTSKIIVACVVSISVVLILVIITVVLLRKFSGIGTRTPENDSIYDAIDEQEINDLGTYNQSQLPGLYETISDYDYATGDSELILKNDYLYADSLHVGEILPNDQRSTKLK